MERDTRDGEWYVFFLGYWIGTFITAIAVVVTKALSHH